MKKFFVPLVLGVVFLVPRAPVSADTILVAYMTGDQSVPPNDSDAQGIAVLTVNDAMDAITYFVAFEGLAANPTGAHIHYGDPGVNGPVIFAFSGIPAATSGVIAGTFTADDFHPGGGLETFADGVQAILAGGCYVNIHDSVYQTSGEIRGQAYVYAP